MTTSEQLEREAEKRRAEIATTLDELRGRVSSAQLMDQMVDYVRAGGGGEFVRNLRQQVVANPVAVTLMGAGLAWLMLGGRSSGPNGHTNGRGYRADQTVRAGSSASGAASGLGGSIGDGASQWGEQARETAGDWSDRAQETAHDWSDSAREAAHDWSDRARDMSARVQDGVASAYDRAASTYGATAEGAQRAAAGIRETASSFRHNAVSAGRGTADFFQQHPLVLAGLGVALGAAVGAALPKTETEDELVGESSDRLKQRAGEVADDQIEKGSAVAESAWEEAKREAENQGLTSASEQHADSPESHGTGSGIGNEATLVPGNDALPADGSASVRESERTGRE